VSGGPRRDARSGCWPTRDQELILRTIFGRAGSSRDAWDALAPTFDVQSIEPGTFSTLPLLYQRLVELGLGHALTLSRLKGIVRSTWVKNNLFLERARETISALAAADVAAVLLPGPTTAARFYPALGLRPTARLDVLVGAPAMGEAAAAIASTGWERTADHPARDGSLVFVDRDERFCTVRAATRGGLWEESEHFRIRDVDVRVLRAEDELFAVCVLGARPVSPPSIQWIVDAATILSRGAPLDWDRLVDAAGSCNQSLRLADAFAYLAELRSGSIPGSVLDMVRRVPVKRRDRVAYGLRSATVPRELVHRTLGVLATRRR
jgi:Uncharacterised nucleotidyltransferase